MKEFIKKNKVFLIFALFFVFVFIQHQFLWLYHDDYGYASLSYAVNVSDVVGHSFSFDQLINFLVMHYNNWGGRILYFGIQCLLLESGLSLFRLAQSIIITFIFYYIYRILNKNIKVSNVLLAILSVFSYGIIEIMVVRSGIFWSTASVLYIFPLLPLLMYIYYYDSSNKHKWYYYLFMGFLIFLASFSQEQIAAAALFYTLIYEIFNFYKTKKISKINVAMIFISLVGFCILMFAPGNDIRMLHPSSGDFYELSLFGKIGRNLPILITNVFSVYSKIFVSLFALMITYITYMNIYDKNDLKKKALNILNILSFFSSILILAFTLLSSSNYFNVFYDLFTNNTLKLGVIFIFCIQLMLMLYSITIYFFKRKAYVILWLSYIGIISQGVMIMAPYYPLRSVIIFEIIYYILFIYCFIEFYKNNKNKILNYAFVLAFVSVTSFNLFTITRGYYRNNYVNSKNNTELINASKKIKSGEEIDIIHLNKLQDITYSGEQPYIEGAEYILEWIREYYNIPADVEIIYE